MLAVSEKRPQEHNSGDGKVGDQLPAGVISKHSGRRNPRWPEVRGGARSTVRMRERNTEVPEMTLVRVSAADPGGKRMLYLCAKGSKGEASAKSEWIGRQAEDVAALAVKPVASTLVGKSEAPTG